jgi:uncharacterized protein
MVEMLEKNKDIRRIQKKIMPILKKNNVVRAGIFGSYARGDATKKSDIDVLIKIKNGKKFSLFDLVGMEMEMEEKLGKKVDLLTYSGLSPYLKKYILEDEIRII